jgi:hypothetical protein
MQQALRGGCCLTHMTTDFVCRKRSDSPSNRVTLTRGSATCAKPVCIMQPAATLVNFVHTKKKLEISAVRYSAIVIFPRAVRDPAHDNGCGPVPYKC